MDINSLTIAEARVIAAMFGGAPAESAIQVGSAYLIRTPTVYHLGRVVRVTSAEIVLDDAGWLADTGRFGECIAKGSYNEYEPMGSGVIVQRCNVCDMTPWRHALPKETK